MMGERERDREIMYLALSRIYFSRVPKREKATNLLHKKGVLQATIVSSLPSNF